jgi:hypothetical protein
MVHGTFVFDVAGVQRGGGLEEHDPAFFFGYWTMLHAAGHDDELADFDPLVAVAKFHAEAAFDYEEHFVFILVVVKDEWAVKLDELDLLSIELGGNAGLVVVSDFSEFFGDVDFGHESLRTGLVATLLMDVTAGSSDARKSKSRQVFADG